MTPISNLAHGIAFPELVPKSDPKPAPRIGQRTRRRGIFAWLIAALHHSRRIQAQRILAQHQHLIARHGARVSNPRIGGDENVGK
jgi:hypothetical protein